MHLHILYQVVFELIIFAYNSLYNIIITLKCNLSYIIARTFCLPTFVLNKVSYFMSCLSELILPSHYLHIHVLPYSLKSMRDSIASELSIGVQACLRSTVKLS